MFQYGATSIFAVRSSVAERPILDKRLYNNLKTQGILKPVRGGVKHREKLQRQGRTGQDRRGGGVLDWTSGEEVECWIGRVERRGGEEKRRKHYL